MKIVVLGAGFAGISAKLTYPEAIVIDENDYMIITPRLVEVIERKLPISHALLERKVDIKAKVLGVDFKEKVVKTSQGNIKFDKLIIALGYDQDISKIKGAEKYSMKFSTLEDVQRINNMKEGATVTILGGGSLGIELSGALVKRGYKVNLIEAENRLIPYLSQEFSKKAQSILEEKGVNIILKAKVEEVKENEIITTQGIIKTDYSIFSAGFSGPKIIKELGLSNKNGRMLVDKFLTSIDFDYVYGAGDCANFKEGFIPQSAQIALQAGEIAIKNALGHEIEFKPNQKAIVLKIADKYLGEIKGTVINGSIAALIKSFALSSLEGKIRRINLLTKIVVD
ncbi:MAG: FAD-dependent oxidoreductase [Sulfolobaceae archaeon]|jgi:NADH dehydrogenase